MVKKGLFVLFTVLCIGLTLIFPAFANAAFSDISNPDLVNIVNDLVSKEIISGFPDGSYRPGDPLTRAQMAKIISKAKNYPLTSAASDNLLFTDVSSNHWAVTYIKASSAAGIIGGYPTVDGAGRLFKPENQITRGELARMLYRALNMPDVVPKTPTYKDVPLAPAKYWAYDAIETVSYYGIMKGYTSGNFCPKQAASRAEIAVSVYKLLNNQLPAPPTVPVEPIEDSTTPSKDGRVVIAVDAGHGGKDPGAIAKSNGLKEKDVNLAVALKLRDLLVSAGYEVVMTRETDVFIELNERARIANSAKVDIFVSVHHNSASDATPTGTAVFCYPGSQEGTALAKLIQQELVKSFGWAGVSGKDDGTFSRNFAVLRETLMPAALCESAYLSNPEEANLLATDEFRQKEAQGICNGIVRYVDINRDEM